MNHFKTGGILTFIIIFLIFASSTHPILMDNNSKTIEYIEPPLESPIRDLPGNPQTISSSSLSHYENDVAGGSWLDSFQDDSGIDWSNSDKIYIGNDEATIKKPVPKPFTVDKNTVALWHFDEGSGSKVNDATSNNNDGTIYGPTWTNGMFKKALKYDGKGSQRVEVSDANSLDLKKVFTIEAWVFREKNTNRDMIVAKEHAYYLQIAYNHKLALNIFTGRNNIFQSKSTIPLGEWVHVAVAADGKNVRLYINGCLDANYTQSVQCNVNSKKVEIGRLYYQPLKWFFKGSIDEVRISNIARSYFNCLANITSKPIQVPNNMQWDKLIINKTQPVITNFSVEILNASNGQRIPGSPLYIDEGEFDISYIDSNKYPRIKLSGTFIEKAFSKILLHYWGVSWNATNAWRDTLFGGSRHIIKYAIRIGDGECWLNTTPTKWIKYDKNPILSPGSSSGWDGSTATYPHVIFNGSGYMMWYTGFDSSGKWEIGLAMSSDGVKWTKYSGNPVLKVSPSKWDSKGVGRPCVIFDGVNYKMWYQGNSGTTGSHKIGYATSNDGINWKKYSGNPVLDKGGASSWENYNVGSPHVQYNGALYKMWYTGGHTSWIYHTGYSTSYDGINWTKYMNNPVLKAPSTNPTAHYIGKGDMNVFRKYDQYHAWYNNDTGPSAQIFYATSPNGTYWIEYANNPVIDRGPTSAWDSASTHAPIVILKDKQYWMYYSGRGSSGPMKVGLARSEVDAQGSVTSSTINISLPYIFNTLILNKTEPNGTYINISLLDAKTDEYITSFSELRGKTINLSALNFQKYSSIRLRANFTSDGTSTPIFHNWAVTWRKLPELELSAGGPYRANESCNVTLKGLCSTIDYLLNYTYRWDLDNDSIFDTSWSRSSKVNLIKFDDFNGTFCIQVKDNFGRTKLAYANIIFNNTSPKASLNVSYESVGDNITGNLSIRIAGEKWHDVEVELYKNGKLIANGTLFRRPGDPNKQMLHFTNQTIDSSANWTAILGYTPDDDPVNGQIYGATPCWVIMNLSNGTIIRIHHTFNVRHNDTHLWVVNLNELFCNNTTTSGYNANFTATIFDPGADSITVHWDFGDGTNKTTQYPNTNFTHPVNISENLTHEYSSSGTYTVILTVWDDDEGVTIINYEIRFT
jgi:predicted GH43/DUF377 family glycosyl hydrolase